MNNNASDINDVALISLAKKVASGTATAEEKLAFFKEMNHSIETINSSLTQENQ